MQHRNRLKRKKDKQKNRISPKGLESSHPEVAAMLSSVKLETSQVNGMVFALSVDRQDAREFAQNWVKENKALVDSWFR